MRRVICVLTVLLVGGGILLMPLGSFPESAARAEEPAAELATLLVDNYGYTAVLTAFDWQDEFISLTKVEAGDYLPNSDDAYLGPFSMGFYFEYYEKTYTQLRVSTNGYLTLDGVVSEQLIRNLDLPSDQKPNSIIAPFWDDLVKGSGDLYVAHGNLEGEDFFAVRWDSFSRFTATAPVTFQVLLFDNGDILFQYGEMEGTLSEASVGIEDGDGVDGISYLFNGTGIAITSSSAILFTRPGVGSRAKLTPLSSGGFIVAGRAQFDITLSNTGDSVDNYRLESLEPSGWQVDFLLDGQIVTNSGPLDKLASQTYQVVVSPPDNAVVGDHAIFDLVATSNNDTNKSASVSVQVAVPAKFMHAYADAQGMNLGRYWKENEISTQFASFDENVALAPAGDNYVMVWDIQEGTAANLSFVVINRLGMPDPYITRLENDIQTNDRFPSLASGIGLNHQVAVVWPRYRLNADQDPIYNLMLAVLNPDLESPVVMLPLQITTNSVPYTTAGGVWMQDAGAFWVGTDKVWIVWKEQQFISPTETTTNIRAGLYNLSTKTWAAGPLSLKTGNTEVYYSDPTLIGLEDGTVLVFFSEIREDLKTQQIYWALLGTTGGIVKQPAALVGLQGGSQDAALVGEKLLLTWVTPDRGAVAYNLISLSGSGSTLSLLLGTTQLLVLENHNLVEHITLFADQLQNGILTWKNVDHTQMYYALVSSDGKLQTPAVMFFRDPSAGIMVSKNGQSSTLYTGAYRLSLPFLSK